MILNMHNFDHLINKKVLKMIKGELIGIIFLLVCEVILIYALFNSDKNTTLLLNTKISLHYIFPVIICLSSLIYLIKRFFKYYRKTAFRFYLTDSAIVLSILSFKNITLTEYTVDNNMVNITYINGFKKDSYKCIKVKSKNKTYLIPIIDEKQNEALKILQI